MSGIAGFYQTKFDYTQEGKWRQRLEQMKVSLLRRGPDGSGSRLFPHAGFAQSRLSVTNKPENSEPFDRQFQGRTCMITYCGELFNSTELKQLLGESAEETDSDAKLILSGYLALGEAVFKELNGSFAFGIYDQRRDLLILCRDRLGVKPLFYQRQEDSLIFGSEPKSLFAYGIKPRLGKDSFRELFGVGPARTLGQGIFRDMKEVLPGHFLTVTDSGIEDQVYWRLEGAAHTDSYQETVAKVSYLVTDSIKRQMLGDLPVSCFLSGGLDSSVVSAVCARELAGKGQQLQTFSFDFDGNSQNFKANSFQSSLDRPFAEIMAAHIGSNHTFLDCDSATQADYLNKAVDAADLPCMGDIESSLLYFCEKVSARAHIALTGEGADEIFGGYPWFHRESALSEACFPWSNDMSFRTSLLQDAFLAEYRPVEYARLAYQVTIAETPRYEGDDEVAARRREISYLTMRWFMVTLLNRMDRTSMYSGLQARVPFGDYRLAEYLYNIPWEMKCRNGLNKNLLIEAGKELLPGAVLHRRKSPYPKTYDPGYERMLGARLREALADSGAPLKHIVDPVKLNRFIESPSDYGKPWYGQLMAGPQMLAYLLQVNYWMEKYQL